MYPLGYQPTLPTGTTFTRHSLRGGYPWSRFLASLD